MEVTCVCVFVKAEVYRIRAEGETAAPLHSSVRFQYKIWWFVTSRGFEYGIFILIIINTLTLAMKVSLI